MSYSQYINGTNTFSIQVYQQYSPNYWESMQKAFFSTGDHIDMRNTGHNMAADVIESAPFPPLASVPLGFIERIDSRTTILGSRFGGAKSGLMEMYVHPSVLITGPIFTNKQVSVVGQPTLGGRATWELWGEQIPTAPVLRGLGNAWRMWVDMQTGIVLRLEYYSGSNLIGWGEMRNVVIDGVGQRASGTIAPSLNSLRTWSLPADALELDYGAYNDSAPTK